MFPKNQLLNTFALYALLLVILRIRDLVVFLEFQLLQTFIGVTKFSVHLLTADLCFLKLTIFSHEDSTATDT